ncbi:MAG: TonB-dependent receptor [Porticoccus sp.]|nr:TonB-dependent receptor [Porticoccus sp.]MBQ0806346.1 TonB-dependent receptor [Porticoccus sp.]
MPAKGLAEVNEPVMESIVVVGVAPMKGSLDTKSLPYAVQVFDETELNKNGVYSVAEMLAARAGSVTFNSAQNNRLQPDLQFRGFTASPLLGLPQGIAVYQNGVRINETFGDSVNWDLLPASTIDSLQLVAGSNPIYGLNALGGAFVVQSKTGFSSPGTTVKVGLASEKVRDVAITTGGDHGDWGYFLAVDSMEEEGWRDFSESRALNIYATLGWRSETQDLDVFFNGADTKLRGNGTVPEALLNERRESVFTHPDITENRLAQISASYRRRYDFGSELSVNLFYRRNTTDSFNGDGSEFEACEAPLDDHFLCDEDESELLRDQFGNPVSAQLDAINNLSQRRQRSGGLTSQWLQPVDLWGIPQQILFGVDVLFGDTDFDSTVEFSSLTEDRGTTTSGLFDQEGRTEMKARSRTSSLYASDLLHLNERLSLTFSARYNDTQVENRDQSGERPELDGRHRYKRFNAGLGMVYLWSDDLSVYGNVQQSSRTPTPVELACSHADAPCSLPNSFLADPPLDDVVAQSAEFGLRGESDYLEHWRVSLFYSVNRDDIIFQTTGGISSNQGFFTNASDTVRKGVELDLSGIHDKWVWYLNYTYLHASFADSFLSSTPNHPSAVDGVLMVDSGSRLPGLPDHSMKLGLDYTLSDHVQLGFEAQANSGQYLRGDEANIDDRIEGYTLLNVYARYQFSDSVSLSFKIDNAFDKEYETFGLYGQAGEIFDDLGDGGGRFLSSGSPRQYWLSIEMNW